MPDSDSRLPRGVNEAGSRLTPDGQCHLIRDIPAGGAERASPAEPGLTAAPDRGPSACEVVLELRVRNHPGTMSHITGLFARRAFNLDAILCVPVDDGTVSRILLLVGDEPRLEQVERQLAKLHDVLSIRHRPELGPATFRWLGEI